MKNRAKSAVLGYAIFQSHKKILELSTIFSTTFRITGEYFLTYRKIITSLWLCLSFFIFYLVESFEPLSGSFYMKKKTKKRMQYSLGFNDVRMSFIRGYFSENYIFSTSISVGLSDNPCDNLLTVIEKR